MIIMRVDGRDVVNVMLVGVIVWLVFCKPPRGKDAAARPVPEATPADDDKVTHVDFGNGERKAKGA